MRTNAVHADSTYRNGRQCIVWGFSVRTGARMLFIFEVELRHGYTAEQYAEAWIRASKLIQMATGAAGTRLHRKLDDPKRLLAIARWRSKADRDAMYGAPRELVDRIIDSQAEFVRVHVIGEFADPEWSVSPAQRDHAERLTDPK